VLSSKELEIFKLLAKGLTNEDTAERLGLTAKSIANRVLAIKQKLNCSRSDFTNIALRYGLIDLHL
jgi:DNA-binding NarL/FixJ family response regulator